MALRIVRCAGVRTMRNLNPTCASACPDTRRKNNHEGEMGPIMCSCSARPRTRGHNRSSGAASPSPSPRRVSIRTGTFATFARRRQVLRTGTSADVVRGREVLRPRTSNEIAALANSQARRELASTGAARPRLPGRMLRAPATTRRIKPTRARGCKMARSSCAPAARIGAVVVTTCRSDLKALDSALVHGMVKGP
jgi:hypothetical protein